MSDIRDKYLREAFEDCGEHFSFFELGGLWPDARAERCSSAVKSGAMHVCQQDCIGAAHDAWKRMWSNVEAVGNRQLVASGIDGIFPDVLPHTGPFDVVHCSGVLYHTPVPATFLKALGEQCRRHLVLCSCVLPKTIQGDVWVYVPGVNESMRRMLSDRFGSGAVGLSSKCEWDVNDTGPYWWLPTESALVRAVLAMMPGWRLVDLSSFWHDRCRVLHLKKED